MIVYMENINEKEYHKMKFIYNAIEHGWSVKKRDTSYYFVKKHNGKQEVFNEFYLEEFIKKNMKLNEK